MRYGTAMARGQVLKAVGERLDVRKMRAVALDAVPAGTEMVKCALCPFCSVVASSVGLGSKLLPPASADSIHGATEALDQPLISNVKLLPAAIVCTVAGVAVAL